MNCQIKVPSSVYYGEGSIIKIEEILKKEKAEKVLVFTDAGIIASGLLKQLTDLLEHLPVAYFVTDKVKPEPSYMDVQEAIAQAETSSDPAGPGHRPHGGRLRSGNRPMF